MKTEIVTAETLERFQESHGDPNNWKLRVGDTVQIRDDPSKALQRRIDLYKAGYIEVDRRDFQ